MHDALDLGPGLVDPDVEEALAGGLEAVRPVHHLRVEVDPDDVPGLGVAQAHLVGALGLDEHLVRAL